MTEKNPNDENHWSEETSLDFINYGRYFIPEREYQMQVISGLLSTLKGENHILDLCCGEGLLDEVILDAYPSFTLQGLDGSMEMLHRAQERLSRFGNRFTATKFDLAVNDWRHPEQTINAVISSMAIHHLTGSQKQKLFTDVFKILAPDGILIIADIIAHPDKMGEQQAAEALDDVVRRRSIKLDGNTAAFEFFHKEGWNIFRYLDPEDIDKPSPLFDQLKWLEQSGFSNVDVHWMLAGHAIFSARKSEIP
jgi:tRNA (cmo5U34)-methyltransferase